MSSEEIAAGIGDCDEATLRSVLEEMAARELIRPDPAGSSPGRGPGWRPR
jgi:hypothetical protein